MKIISIILAVFLATSSFAGLNAVTQNSMTTNGAPNNTVNVPALDASGNMVVFGNATVTNSAGNTASLDIIGNAGTGGVDIKLQSTPSGLNVTGGSAGLLTATLFGGSGASLVGYAAAFGVGSAAVATNLAPNVVLTTNQVSQDGGAMTNLNRNANGITNYVFAPTNSVTPSIIGGTVYTPTGTNAAFLLGILPTTSLPSVVVTNGAISLLETDGNGNTNLSIIGLSGRTNFSYGLTYTNVDGCLTNGARFSYGTGAGLVGVTNWLVMSSGLGVSNGVSTVSGFQWQTLQTNGSVTEGQITVSNQNLLLGTGNNEGIQSAGFIQFNISGGSGGGKQIQFMDAGNNVLTYDNTGGATWHFVGAGRISFFTNSAPITSITNDPVPGGWVLLPNARTSVRVKVASVDSLTVNGQQILWCSNSVNGRVTAVDQLTVPLGVSGTVSSTNILKAWGLNPNSMISVSNSPSGTAVVVVPDNSTSIDAN